jgi:hypothetical protein
VENIFVTPTKLCATYYGRPFRVHKPDGTTVTIDDFVTGRVALVTAEKLVYVDSHTIRREFNVAEGCCFEVLSPSSVT